VCWTLSDIGEGAFTEGQDKHAQVGRRIDDDKDEDEDEVVYHEGDDGEGAEVGGAPNPCSRRRGRGKQPPKGRRVPK
jgi:hypothetical protein